MSRLKRFARLAPSDRRLFLASLVSLALVKFALRVTSMRTVRARVLWVAHAFPRTQSPLSLPKLTWAIETASSYVPDATCLPQALVAEGLLVRHGLPARVRLGATREEGRDLTGHAWVESGQVVVVGGPDAGERFTGVVTLEGPDTPLA